MKQIFKKWAKIPRLENEEWIITEKIDGTNACVVIISDKRAKQGLKVFAQSRTRIITPKDDNFGFAQWVKDNKEQLKLLGPGYHYGEWYGQGIQRNYGLKERRFALFNIFTPVIPKCCELVPLIATTPSIVKEGLDFLINNVMHNESKAVPGFKKFEGLIIQSTIYQNLRYKYIVNDNKKK